MDCAKAFKIVNGLVEKYNEDMLAQSNSILNLVKENLAQSQSAIISLLNGPCKSYSQEKKALYAKHKIGSTVRFSFFETVAESLIKYNGRQISDELKKNFLEKENLHSDILFTILNPDTPEIGRKYFLEEFVKFLDIENRFDCTKDFGIIVVIKEQPTGKIAWTDNDGQQREKEGYIDLLIKNDEQAIIIENKINYAPDMDNQLVRYMKYVDEELGIKTYTVVYLTLIDDKEKKPPLEFDKGFKKYKEMLNDKKTGILKELYAVDGEKSLANNLLPKLCERLQEEQERSQSQNVKESCDIARVYINQYKILLEHLGGKAYMNSVNKKLIEDIYSSQDKWDAANDFVKFWENKNEPLREVMEEKFRKTFPDKKLQWLEINGSKEYSWPSKFEDAKVYWNGERQVGFVALEGKKFSKARQDELFKVIEKIQKKEGDMVKREDIWVYCDIKDNSTLFGDILNGLKILFDV